jgi:hypothetical protein
LAKESETANDPFYQLIQEYQRSRLALLANEKSFQKLKVQAEEEKLKVWTLHDKQVSIALTLTISFVTMYLYMFIRVTRLDEFSPNG